MRIPDRSRNAEEKRRKGEKGMDGEAARPPLCSFSPFLLFQGGWVARWLGPPPRSFVEPPALLRMTAEK